jgi:hypothetical protein
MAILPLAQQEDTLVRSRNLRTSRERREGFLKPVKAALEKAEQLLSVMPYAPDSEVSQAVIQLREALSSG